MLVVYIANWVSVATLIWHQNLVVSATQLAPQPPSQPPYELVRTNSSTPLSVYGARDGRIHSGGVIK